MPLIRKEKNNINRMKDREILSAVRNQMEGCGIKITNTQCIFFLQLVDYAIQKGEITEKGLRIYLTEDDMVKLFKVSKSFVTLALSLFTKAEVIDRNITSEQARTIFGDGRVRITTINKKFYEQ